MAFKGGFIRGHHEVRAYWTEQWGLETRLRPLFPLRNDVTRKRELTRASTGNCPPSVSPYSRPTSGARFPIRSWNSQRNSGQGINYSAKAYR